MTFGAGRALTLEELEQALLRAIRDRPLEVLLDVPGSGRGMGARLANMFPRLTGLAVERIVEKGRAVQKERSCAR